MKKARRSKKREKYYKIANESLDGHFKGFCHRQHRTHKKKKNDKDKFKNIKLQKIKEKEIQDQINNLI